MIATATALLLAHVLADFLLQPDGWIETKKRPLTLFKHALVVLALSLAAPGSLHPAIFALVLAHLVIDAFKVHLLPAGIGAFLLDQAAHLATIAAVSLLYPTLWADGLWMRILPAALEPGLMRAALLATGFLIATQAGGYAVGLLMRRYQTPELPQGLTNAGRMIGWLERALIFLFTFSGQPLGIGFLIAAKSILRFDTAAKDQRASEYVIIGTLASFGWALAASFATLRMLEIAGMGP